VTIDWIHFTPGRSFAGGIAIGLAAVGLLLGNGRVAGISGILGGLFRPLPGEVAWRLAFLIGLIGAPSFYGLVAPVPASHVDGSVAVLALAGLLVGFGTRLGSGCTSGHGVCGLSNLSPRSLAAVLTFMAAGFLTVLAVRHGLG